MSVFSSHQIRHFWWCVLLFVSVSSTAAESPDAAISAHMDAINSHDDARIIESQRFPFGHLWPNGTWEITDSPGEFQPINWSARLGSDWNRSVLEVVEQIIADQLSATYRIEFTRRRSDDSVLGRYEAIWIATRSDDQWKVQFRHGAIKISTR